jgi:hypothetical protein
LAYLFYVVAQFRIERNALRMHHPNIKLRHESRTDTAIMA